MAFVPLENPVEWGFDTTTNQLMIRMRDRDPAKPDAAPTREAIVRLTVASVNLVPLTI